MRTKISYLLAFYLFWLACSGVKIDYIYLIFSLLITVIVLFIGNRLGLISLKSAKVNPIKLIGYFLWLIKEVVLSSIAVSKIAWRRNVMTYQIIEPLIPSQNSELGTVIYANSITLTPGTVVISEDVQDKNFPILLVHALDLKFMDDLKEGAMDRKITLSLEN